MTQFNIYNTSQKRKQKYRIIKTCLQEKISIYEEFRQVHRQSVLNLGRFRELHRKGAEEPTREKLFEQLISGSVRLNTLVREITVLEAMRNEPLYWQVQLGELGAVINTDQ
jgi:hypothetical protein